MSLPVEGREPYVTAARALLREHDVRVVKWRSASSGVAYTGRDEREIECPPPTGAISFGILAHEVGHQALHRRNDLPRWQEEIEAWQFALDAFDRLDVPGRERALRRASRHVGRAIGKVLRRKPSDVTLDNIEAGLPGWLREEDAREIRLRLRATRERRAASA